MGIQSLDNINLSLFKVMIRKGVPDNLRSSIWQKMIGSDVLYTANIGIFDK